MPRMSGFEFLKIVRVRLPHIPLIAKSGAYDLNAHFPSGLIADAAVPKGVFRFTELEQIAADSIRATTRENLPARGAAPVQVPVFKNQTGGELFSDSHAQNACEPFQSNLRKRFRWKHERRMAPSVQPPVRYFSPSLAAMLRKVIETTETVR